MLATLLLDAALVTAGPLPLAGRLLATLVAARLLAPSEAALLLSTRLAALGGGALRLAAAVLRWVRLVVVSIP